MFSPTPEETKKKAGRRSRRPGRSSAACGRARRARRRSSRARSRCRRRRARRRRTGSGRRREGPQHERLEQDDREQPGAGGDLQPALRAAAERQPDDDQHEQEEGDRARRGGQRGERGEAPGTPGLERPEREQRERGAEREREGGGEDDPRPDDREGAARPACARAPLAPDDHGEGERRRRDRRDGEQPDAESGRERVVEQAVGDEAVAARVPEVVPEGEAVVQEQRRAGRRAPRDRFPAAPPRRAPRRMPPRRPPRALPHVREAKRGTSGPTVSARCGHAPVDDPLVREENCVGERAGGRDDAWAVIDDAARRRSRRASASPVGNARPADRQDERVRRSRPRRRSPASCSWPMLATEMWTRLGEILGQRDGSLPERVRDVAGAAARCVEADQGGDEQRRPRATAATARRQVQPNAVHPRRRARRTRRGTRRSRLRPRRPCSSRR